MTKDDHLVVLHDPTLDRTTDVAARFPERSRLVRGERRWMVADFTLAEIKSLRVTEGFEPVEGAEPSMRQVYPGRFPMWQASFRVATLQEAIELVQGLNHSTGREIGIYPEIKSPWWFRAEGKDISRAVLQVLKEYGYDSRNDRIYLQCFDPNELRRIDRELMPELGMDLKLVQLIAENDWGETYEPGPGGGLVPYDYDWMFEPEGMERVAGYAEGVGPSIPMLIDLASTLEVHPYTFRLDPGRIPDYAEDFEDLLRIFFAAGVDGVFTDFPDRVVRIRERAARN
jgi:glycerophosphoryl diester phosphodiesterase